MVNYREIIRLYALNMTYMQICNSVRSSKSTVKEVVDLSEKMKISWPLEPEVTNDVLETLLYPNRTKEDSNRMPIDFPRMHRELAKKGVTVTLLWTEYCIEAANAGKIPYKSTQFNDLYRAWARISKATMRITRKPGDNFEVDWAGATVDIYDSVTGEATPAYLFVGALSCSGYVYAELCTSMESSNFIACHVHAYEYFGGVTRLLTPDNLRAGVTKNTRYETIIPRAYREMAEHYDTAIVPARVESPDDKPNAEGSVKFATTWILAALRNEHFFTFAEAKKAVAEKLEELNNRPFKKRPGNRKTAYETEEKEFMLPLPKNRYEPAIWSTATVPNDYCISDGLNRYSVPFDLIGNKVDIRVTQGIVEVFFHGNRVASHVRKTIAQRDAITVPEHMPEAHRKYLSYNKEEFINWGKNTGSSTEKVIRSFLTASKEPEQGFKYCASLMKAADRYGSARVEAACARVLAFSSVPSLRNITTVLKNGQDKIPLHKGAIDTEPAAPSPRSRGITRGADAFKKGGVNS